MAQARHLRSTPAAVLSTLVDSDAAANQHLSEALQGLGDRSTQQQMEAILPLLTHLTETVGIWLLSHHQRWAARDYDALSKPILVRMPLIAAHLRATTALARSGNAIPSALTTARACLEVGVTTGWLCDPGGKGEATRERIRSVEHAGVKWMRRMAAVYGKDGWRWTVGANQRDQLLNSIAVDTSLSPPAAIPSMRDRLRDLQIENRYPLYMVASEVLHGGAVAGGDYESGTGSVPYGLHDWIAIFNMCVVGARCATFYSIGADAEQSQLDTQPFDSFQTFTNAVLGVLVDGPIPTEENWLIGFQRG